VTASQTLQFSTSLERNDIWRPTAK